MGIGNIRKLLLRRFVMSSLKGIPSAILILAVLIMGCSHGASPIESDVRETTQPMAAVVNGSHNLMGLYTFICDPGKGTVDVIPLRDAEFHLNALKFLEPPPLVYIILES
jgi:hypothetical protein